MESENDKETTAKKKEPIDINITHDDLSDVSDLDDSIGCHSEEEREEQQREAERQEKEREEGEIEKSKMDELKIEPEIKKVSFLFLDIPRTNYHKKKSS